MGSWAFNEGDGSGNGMFAKPKPEKQVDKSARKAERANEALKDMLGEVEKSAKVQVRIPFLILRHLIQI